MRTQAAEERLGSGREGGGLPKRVIRAREPTESLRGRTATVQYCASPGVPGVIEPILCQLGVREAASRCRLVLRWYPVHPAPPPSVPPPGQPGWVG